MDATVPASGPCSPWRVDRQSRSYRRATAVLPLHASSTWTHSDDARVEYSRPRPVSIQSNALARCLARPLCIIRLERGIRKYEMFSRDPRHDTYNMNECLHVSSIPARSARPAPKRGSVRPESDGKCEQGCVGHGSACHRRLHARPHVSFAAAPANPECSSSERRVGARSVARQKSGDEVAMDACCRQSRLLGTCERPRGGTGG